MKPAGYSMRLPPVFLLIAALRPARAAPSSSAGGGGGSFGLGGAGNNSFVKDGAPFRFMAGSMHYWRNKPSEWRPKLQLMRDMGLNAVLTPTNWGWHEPQEGVWDFGGQKDLVKFVHTAHKVGLLVLLRLGSYATAEMDMGGVPYWMITKNITTIRSLDPVWQEYEQRYFAKLFSLVVPLQYPAGPVVGVQLGDDSDVSILKNSYYQLLRAEFRRLGATVPLNTLICPGSKGWWGGWSQADLVRMNGSWAALEFSANDALDTATLKSHFDFLRQQFPRNNPLWNMEYYPGWIDLEGSAHKVMPPDKFAIGLDNQLSLNASVSIYMAQGGTNFGFMGGGEWQGGHSRGIAASYDYAAPITEGGDLGPKFLPTQR